MNLLFQLQAKENDPVAGIIFLSLIGAAILIVFVMGIIRNGLGMGKKPSLAHAKQGSKTKSPVVVAARQYSFFAFRKLCKAYRLNRDQSKVLEQVFRNNGVTDVVKAISDPVALDRHFKYTYNLIEKTSGSAEDAQQRIALLFSARNVIDYRHNTSSSPVTGSMLAPGMDAVFSANQKSWTVKIISCQPNSVLIECPTTPLGTQIRFTRGTEGKLAFFSKTNKGFSLDTKILDIQSTSFGPALMLSRGRNVKQMTQRRFRRKQTTIDCNLYMVYVDQIKPKAPPKLTVDKRRMKGSIADISIGGCAIKTQHSVNAGNRIKIEFEHENHLVPAAMLGQVLRTNRSGLSQTIVHVKFLKVPPKTMNAINAIIYDF